MSVGNKILSFFTHQKNKQEKPREVKEQKAEIIVPTHIHLHITGDEGTGRASFVLNYLEALPEKEPFIVKANSFEANEEAYFKYSNISLAHHDVNLTFSIKKDRPNPFLCVPNKPQKECDIALIMVDVGDRYSLENAARWYQELQRDLKENARVVIVANKTDKEERKVSTAEIQELAERFNCEFYSTSALREDVSFAVHQMIANAVNQIVAANSLAHASEVPTFAYTDIRKKASSKATNSL